MKLMQIKINLLCLAFAMLCSCSATKKVTENIISEAKGPLVVITEEKKMQFEYLFVEGLKQKIIGNLEAARQCFNDCLEINPNAASVMFELANIYTQKGDFTGAKLLLEKAIQINPDNKWYKLLLAQIYQRDQDYLKASELYKALIAKEPGNVDYYFLNALLLTSGEKFDEAIKAYDQLEKVTGYNAQIALARQQVFRQAKKNKEAYAELERLIASDPKVPEYYGVMADMYKEDGNMSKALEYYNKVLEMDPQNGFVHFSLASFHAQSKNLEAAFKHASIGFANPELELETKVQLYLMLISAPADQKLSEKQMDELTLLISETHPGDPRSFGIRADFLIQTNRKQEARDFIAQAVEKDPNNYGLWEQLIQLDNELGDLDLLITDANKAIGLFPNQPLIYLFQSIAYLQKKEYDKSLETLETGQSYVVENPKMEAQFELYKAEAHYNLNHPEKAFASFEKVLEMEPNNYMAMNNYAYYLSVKGINLDRAEALSSKVVQVHPDNPTYVDTHAWVLFRKKEYRLAKFYIETALKNGGNENDVVLEHYGDILFMLNDSEGALDYWKKAAEMGSESKTLKRKIEEKKYFEEEE